MAKGKVKGSRSKANGPDLIVAAGPSGRVPVPSVSYSAEETARVEAYREKRRRQAVPKFAATGDSSITATRDDELTEASIAAATGIADLQAGLTVLDQVARTSPATARSHPSERLNTAMTAMMGIEPQDALEGMLAAQMVTANNLIMTFAERAANSTDVGLTSANSERVIRLMRTYTMQLEALAKYRGRGQQKITVEHVTVNEGGQAIVGHVTTAREQSPSLVRAVTDAGATLPPSRAAAPYVDALVRDAVAAKGKRGRVTDDD